MSDTSNQTAPTASQGGLARWVVIAVLGALLVAAGALAYLGWSRTDTEVPASGYVALVLGVVFSLVVGVGLMALIFYSSRQGYDEPATLIPDPESDPDGGRDNPR
ncbi:hypothetical protein JQ580_18830 [Bradyrhizobium japonicum]|uniref:hypothetical protein n=1 Tax=Bradyrhizobium japonicum TaxID=375 RepID=UPI001BADD774|nr:hypothetical protein [Bradyrhizobium japonicum]MBR0992772.1 hypothetical protein [Bradyrhizobium japonicum]